MRKKAGSWEGVAGEGFRSADDGGEIESGSGDVDAMVGCEEGEEERDSEGGGGMGAGFGGE